MAASGSRKEKTRLRSKKSKNLKRWMIDAVHADGYGTPENPNGCRWEEKNKSERIATKGLSVGIAARRVALTSQLIDTSLRKIYKFGFVAAMT